MINFYNFILSYKNSLFKKNISVQECLYNRGKFVIFQSKMIVLYCFALINIDGTIGKLVYNNKKFYSI